MFCLNCFHSILYSTRNREQEKSGVAARSKPPMRNGTESNKDRRPSDYIQHFGEIPLGIHRETEAQRRETVQKALLINHTYSTNS